MPVASAQSQPPETVSQRQQNVRELLLQRLRELGENVKQATEDILRPVTASITTRQQGAMAPPTQDAGTGRGPICALAPNKLNNSDNTIGTVRALVHSRFPTNVEESNVEEINNIEESNPEYMGGLTVKENPTFLFYLPAYIKDSRTQRKLITQFVLLDSEANHPVWNELMAVEMTGEPQLVEYLLSDYPLESGKFYTWYFSVICDSDKLSRNPVVRGWIRRIDPKPEVQMALVGASALEQYLVYAKYDIWFDAISTLIKLRRDLPATNEEVWLSLLKHFKIDQLEDSLKVITPIEREVVINGYQLPVSM